MWQAALEGGSGSRSERNQVGKQGAGILHLKTVATCFFSYFSESKSHLRATLNPLSEMSNPSQMCGSGGAADQARSQLDRAGPSGILQTVRGTHV